MCPIPVAQKNLATVLVVDDEDGVLHAIRHTLENLDYRIVATTDAHYALQILENDSSIDLLITDLFMPAMDGATLLDRSRRIRPNLRVVLTSGIASEQQLRRWRARGEVIVPKPWFDEELVDAVRKALVRAPGYGRR
jgi:two-component system cell cycle sensor histidine kinase/response regulator CckA